MEIEQITQDDNSLLIILRGDMDVVGCNKLQPELEKIINKELLCNINMDLGGVDFLDSSGIGAIVFLYKRLKAEGFNLSLSGVHGQPLEIIKLLRINTAMNITEQSES